MGKTTLTTSVNLTLSFMDDTTRTVTFNGVDDTEISNVAARVKAINSNMSQAFKETFISKDGAYCRSISRALVISTQEEVLYSAN